MLRKIVDVLFEGKPLSKEMDDFDKLLKSNSYLKRANPEQKKAISDMQVGDLWMFTELLQRLKGNIEMALEVTVNQVEGDTSQLPDELVKYAEKRGWLEGY